MDYTFSVNLTGEAAIALFVMLTLATMAVSAAVAVIGRR